MNRVAREAAQNSPRLAVAQVLAASVLEALRAARAAARALVAFTEALGGGVSGEVGGRRQIAG